MGSASSPVDNCELDLALSDSTPLRNDPPCHPVIRRYPTNDQRPPISSIPRHEVAPRMFLPPRKARQPPFCRTLQVFGEFCGSANGATCAALLCLAPPSWGSSSFLLPCHNQEQRELRYAFQNATHRDLTCCAKCKVVQRPS